MPDLSSLSLLMDELINVGVSIETIRVISAGVRQAVADVKTKRLASSREDRSGGLRAVTGGDGEGRA